MSLILIPIPYIVPRIQHRFHTSLMQPVTRIIIGHGVTPSDAVPIYKRRYLLRHAGIRLQHKLYLNTYDGQISTLPSRASTTESGSDIVKNDAARTNDLLRMSSKHHILHHWPMETSTRTPAHPPPRTYHHPFTLRHYAARASSDVTRPQLPLTSNHTSTTTSVRRKPSRIQDLRCSL